MKHNNQVKLEIPNPFKSPVGYIPQTECHTTTMDKEELEQYLTEKFGSKLEPVKCSLQKHAPEIFGKNTW